MTEALRGLRLVSRARAAALLGAALLAAAVGLAACGGDDDEPPGASDELTASVIEHYADGVHASYQRSLDSATIMQGAIETFVEQPTTATLEAAKRAWLNARDDYGPTEAYRFYGGPIDNDEDSPEGQLNAWPMDEGYVDYVEGAPNSGIINMVAEYPQITMELLIELNEAGGETNVSTGWHAIEFLLWGQDLNPLGPGSRPVEDYTTNANAERDLSVGGDAAADRRFAADGGRLVAERVGQLPGVVPGAGLEQGAGEHHHGDWGVEPRGAGGRADDGGV